MWIDNNDKIMDILDNAEPSKAIKFPAACPICKNKEAHLFFYRYKEDSDRGSMWVWCSSCKHSAHAMFRVPKWWINLSTVKFEELSNSPDILEKNKEKLDSWINQLLYSK